MLLLDADGTIVVANRAVAAMFGYAADELGQRSITTLLASGDDGAHPAHGAAPDAISALRVMRAGPHERVGVRKDGATIPVECVLTPVQMDGGAMAMAAIVDISARKGAEIRFRRVVEAAPVAMLLVSPDAHIALANAAAEHLLGYALGALTGRPVADLIPDDLRARHRAHMDAFVSAQGARAMGSGREFPCVCHDGRQLTVDIGLSQIEMPEGIFTLATLTDLAERKRAESVQAELAAIVRGSADAIIGAGRDGRVSSWNDGASRIFGYDAAEMLGKAFTTLVPERTRTETEWRLDAVLRGEVVANVETVHRRRDGSEVAVSLTKSPICAADGTIVGVSTIARDISAQRQREAELVRSHTELEQFAAVASHDLQEPLRMVASYTALLAERYKGQLDERADRYIKHAVDGAMRMQSLINSLLELARVRTHARRAERVRVGEAVDAAIRNLERAVVESGATFTRSELPTVWADPVQLVQLFQNLFANGLRYRGASTPRLSVSASAVDGAHVFAVRDNGIGFEMQFAERIFAPFQRLHARGTYEGSGIGLSICRRIVERHGGRIWAESAPGEGSTFCFSWPFASMTDAAGAPLSEVG